jgi:hypothetical protein
MLGDLLWFNEPLNARPMPVRAVDTMTASLMGTAPIKTEENQWSLPK